MTATADEIEHIGMGYGASVRYFGRILCAPLVDASPLFSGAAAGMAARTVVAVTDRMHVTEPKSVVQHGVDLIHRDTRDITTRIRRRGMFYGILFWLYTSMHRRAQFDEHHSPNGIRLRDRVKKSALISSFAAVTSRLAVNVWTNVSDAARAKFMSKKTALKYMTKHDSLPGVWSIFCGQPPATTALVYHGATIFLFEALRRLLRGPEPLDADRYRRTHVAPVVATAVFNGTLASLCAMAVSAATIRFSKPYYKNEITRPNALNRLPYEYVLRREALLVGLTYGTFTLLQPIVSPHHSRCGFGY